LDANTGKLLWSFDSLAGPVVSTPVVYKDYVLFGAWDTYLYALNKLSGKLIWKWNNGSAIRNYSPASCIPVIAEDIVFVVAPDRYITAISLQTGKTLWRNNDATVRESIGISADRKWVYGKTMQDTVVAYSVSGMKQAAAWKMNCGFGYEHVPSMLIEKKGQLYFGTRNGVVYCINIADKKIDWAHKIDNSMVNTVNVLKDDSVVAATMDGKLVYIKQSN
jgi:outer membrane protein assembly factor BamB